MKSVAIVHGWAEGPWQSKRLRKHLSQKGFQYTKQGNSADVVITHSFGCYLVPKKSKASLIVLINPAYWPGRTLATSAIKKQKEDLMNTHRHSGLMWWASKLLHNGWYILSKPRLSYYLFSHHKPQNIPRPQKARKVVIVRNSNDTFCPPNILDLLKEEDGYKLVKFNGGHDDCWMNPEPYIDLLLKELR